ncbi:MAG: SemiSWEET transporter [Betaproteobacteria bacterium]|nr:SemiSWEET transporter [Betaproteobacteria bacterium]
MISLPDALGLAAGTLTTIAFIPQVVRIVRTRSAHDISWWMFTIFSVGVALWLGYGLMLDALPVILANVVTLGLALVILVLKWRYGRDLPRPAYGAEQEADDRSERSQ